MQTNMSSAPIPYSSQTGFFRVQGEAPPAPLTAERQGTVSATVPRQNDAPPQILPQASAQAVVAFLDAPAAPETAKVPSAPSLEEIAKGHCVMQQGQEGPAVEELKELLKAVGYSVGMNPIFGTETAARVADFQADMGLARKGSPYSGQVGPQTLNKMRAMKEALTSGSVTGQRLANYAAKHRSGGTGLCYSYVANAVDAQVGRFLWGMHAYMAADQLAEHPRFQEIKVPASQLPKLPAGAVVVWGKGSSKSGHISIADGNGREISDHRAPQMTHHYGGASHRVFMPLD